jgi:hypothetical protein
MQPEYTCKLKIFSRTFQRSLRSPYQLTEGLRIAIVLGESAIPCTVESVQHTVLDDGVTAMAVFAPLPLNTWLNGRHLNAVVVTKLMAQHGWKCLSPHLESVQAVS